MFYKIELLSIPKFLFCCSASVNNYRNEFKKRKDFLEISLVEEGNIEAEENGKKYIIEPHSLNIITSDRDCVLSAKKNELQRHSTVGLNVKYNLTECSRKEAERYGIKENVIFLPKIRKLDDKEYNSVLFKIKKIAAFVISNKLSAISALYALCSEISEITLSNFYNSSHSPSSNVYTEQACKYITEHFNEHISISKVAAFVGISEGYLQNIFKKVTGKSIIEYVNEYKIKTAAEMLKAYNMKLKDITQYVGFDDPAYMSRLFKKVMGINFEEYRKNLYFTEISFRQSNCN